jgi:hypothetical protein
VSAASRNVVWLSPNATAFSCLCEACLEGVRARGGSFLDAVREASVRGAVARDSHVAFARCRAGHDVVVRRVERPPRLAHADERQLQLG